MSTMYVCSVGISLLQNYNKQHNIPNSKIPSEENLQSWMEQTSPEIISAETNTLRFFEIGEGDRLDFIYSDTPEGKFCAEQLKIYYKKQIPEISNSIELHKIQQLGYGAHQFSAGLKGLVDKVIHLYEMAQRNQLSIELCASGGFKAEFAYLNLLGALLHFNVFYLHEKHKELVQFPPLPIDWDVEEIKQHSAFFEWIDEEPRKSEEVENRLKQYPNFRTLVEVANDGCTYLSPIGNLLYRVSKEYQPRAKWPEHSPRRPEQKNMLSKEEHHRAKGFEKVIQRLCEIDCVEQVRYDDYKGNEKIKIVDADQGQIRIIYGSGESNKLALLIDTTAKGWAQTQLVADYIKNSILNKLK